MLLLGAYYRGSFATVKVGIPKNGSENVAIKIIDKKVKVLRFTVAQPVPNL
jgi:hypothetical protein